MSLSTSKCAFLSTGSASTYSPYNNEGTPITRVSHYCDLGVFFDDKGKFRVHATNLATSIARLGNTILSTFVSNAPEFHLKLYTSLIVAKIIYCSQVWSPVCLRDLSL